jgi:hypothetical protein
MSAFFQICKDPHAIHVCLSCMTVPLCMYYSLRHDEEKSDLCRASARHAACPARRGDGRVQMWGATIKMPLNDELLAGMLEAEVRLVKHLEMTNM